MIVGMADREAGELGGEGNAVSSEHYLLGVHSNIAYA
jgi:hypothetical protein